MYVYYESRYTLDIFFDRNLCVYYISAYNTVYENVHICTKVCAQLRFVLPSDKNYIAHIADTKRSLKFFCVWMYLFSVYVYEQK